MSKIKVNEIEKISGSGITIPTGTSFTVTDGIPATNLSGTIADARLPTVPVAKGGTGLTSLGSAGQVVKVNSGASGLEFGTVSSDMVKILTTTTSGTTVTIDNIFSSDYYFYQVYIDSYNSVAARNLGMRVLIGGSEQQGSDYTFGGNYVSRASGSASTGTDTGWNDSYMKIANGSGAANHRTSGVVNCFNPTDSSNHKQFTYHMASWNTTNDQYNYHGGGTARYSGALSGLSFKFHGDGTMTLGRVSVYGLKV
tara:strand:- start:2220 stop:2981 length:762 start_codon:yes stop_codon:yes gene_type:complete